MENIAQNALINRFSLRHGLLLGFVSVAISVVLRFIDPMLLLVNIWISVIVLVLFIALMTILGLDVRKKIGNYWSFGDAFKSLIIMAAIVTLFSNAYNFVIFKYVDPELPVKMNNVMLDNMTTRLSKAGLSDDKIDEYTKQFKNGEFVEKMKPTLKNELVSVVTVFLLYAVIALIIAACIKKKALLIASEDGGYPGGQV